MNTAVYLFILTAFMILKAMMIPGATASILGPPTFDTFPVDEAAFTALVSDLTIEDCNEFLLCLNVPFEIIAEAIVRVFDFFVIVVKIILNIIVFVAQLVALVIALAVTQIPGAPVYVNMLLITIPAIMLGLALINAFKPGVSAE